MVRALWANESAAFPGLQIISSQYIWCTICTLITPKGARALVVAHIARRCHHKLLGAARRRIYDQPAAAHNYSIAADWMRVAALDAHMASNVIILSILRRRAYIRFGAEKCTAAPSSQRAFYWLRRSTCTLRNRCVYANFVPRVYIYTFGGWW